MSFPPGLTRTPLDFLCLICNGRERDFSRGFQEGGGSKIAFGHGRDRRCRNERCHGKWQVVKGQRATLGSKVWCWLDVVGWNQFRFGKIVGSLTCHANGMWQHWWSPLAFAFTRTSSTSMGSAPWLCGTQWWFICHRMEEYLGFGWNYSATRLWKTRFSVAVWYGILWMQRFGDVVHRMYIRMSIYIYTYAGIFTYDIHNWYIVCHTTFTISHCAIGMQISTCDFMRSVFCLKFSVSVH